MDLDCDQITINIILKNFLLRNILNSPTFLSALWFVSGMNHILEGTIIFQLTFRNSLRYIVSR